MKRFVISVVAVLSGLLMTAAFVCLVLAIVYSLMYSARYLLLIPVGAVIGAVTVLPVRWISKHNGGQ